MPQNAEIRLRRDTAANWTATNPTLALGEMGLETDTRKMKFGDGATAWTGLSYTTASASLVISGTGFPHVTVGVLDAAAKLVDTADVNNSQITLAKLADMATASLYYRKTAGTGAPEVNTLATLKSDLGLTGTNTGDQTITLTGNVTGSGTGSFAATIANSAVTLAKQADVATATVFYRKTAGTGAPEVQTLATLKTDLGLTGTNTGDQTSIVGITGTIAQFNTACTDADFATGGGTATGTNTGDQTITLTGNVTGSGVGSFAATIANDAVTLAKMQNAVANSKVLGSGAAGAGADYVEITLGTNLTMSGTTLNAAGGAAPTGTGFVHITAGVQDAAAKLVDTADINNNQVTLGKMATVATSTVFYRKTAATGDPEVQTLATMKTDLGLTGTNSGDQTITLTSDVTGSGSGSFATTIAAGVVTLAKMANMATDSLIGRDTAASGVPEIIGVTGGIEFSGAGAIRTSAFTGDVTKAAGGTALTIPAGTVTLAMQANMATASVVYRKTAGSGAPEVQTLATLKTDLGLTGTNSGDQTITLTSDVTGSGTSSFATTIANSAVTLAKMADVATARILGRVTAATGVVEALTGTQATTLLDTVTSSLKGLAPASGGGSVNYLRADGTWAVPPGGSGFTPPTGTGFVHMTAGVLDGASKLVDTADINANQVTLGKMATVATASVFYRKTAGTGDPEVQTLATLKSDLGLTGTNSGDQTITLTSDVTGSGVGSFATTIAAGAVTLAKMANIATDSLIGRDTAATGVPEAITVTGGIEFNGSGSIRTTAFTGDVTKTAGGTALTIANDAVTTAKILDDNVTLAKIANAAASSILVGSGASGSGANYVEIALGTNLSMSGTTLNASGGGAAPTGTGFYHVTGGVMDAASKLIDTADINNDQVTYAKFQNAAAANVVLCNASASTAVDYAELALSASTLLGRGATGNVAACTLGATLSFSAAVLSVASVPQTNTFNNAGTGDASGTAFNGSVARTTSWNTIGAQPSTPREQAQSGAVATLTPTFSNDICVVTGLSAAMNIANPTGTAVPNAGLVIRIKDNGTARGLTYGTNFRAMGTSLPSTTVVNKTMYLGFIFNNTDTKWDLVSVAQEV